MQDVKKTSYKRNYGIDLLRVLSMFFVVILHCLGQGGILSNTVLYSSQYKLAWLLEIIAYCAVDIFAIISGYVTVTGKDENVKYNKYIELWFQVVFYSIIITLFFDITGLASITPLNYIKSFFPVTGDFPVTGNLYWYFTAYTGLFVLKPFLDKAINRCSVSMMRKLFIAILFVFSVYNIFTQKFVLSDGYSFIWIIILYILGAAIKKGDIGKKIKPYQALFGIAFLVLITYLNKIYGPEEIEWLKNNFSIVFNKNTFLNYTSPTILGCAILYVIAFSKISFNEISIKIIKFMAVSSFSIYLLNTHYLVWNNFMIDLFVSKVNSSIYSILGNIIGFSLLFVFGAVLIDKIRIFIFKIFRINKISLLLSSLLNKFIIKISEVI